MSTREMGDVIHIDLHIARKHLTDHSPFKHGLTNREAQDDGQQAHRRHAPTTYGRCLRYARRSQLVGRPAKGSRSLGNERAAQWAVFLRAVGRLLPSTRPPLGTWTMPCRVPTTLASGMEVMAVFDQNCNH